MLDIFAVVIMCVELTPIWLLMNDIIIKLGMCRRMCLRFFVIEIYLPRPHGQSSKMTFRYYDLNGYM